MPSLRAFAAVIALPLAACSPEPSVETGTVLLAVGSGARYDVAAFDIAIHPAGASCSDPAPLVSARVPLAPQVLPAPSGLAFGHQLAVLPVGDYLVCATPLKIDQSASALCRPTSASNVSVAAGSTTEVQLVSSCDADGNGGVDVVVALNEDPVIDDIVINPSKFLHLCETASLAVTASDAESDPLTFAWAVTSAPAGSSPVLIPAGATASFDTDLVGTYTITVTATDPHGGTAEETFPLHVDADPCAGPGHVAWLLAGGDWQSDEATAAAVFPNGDVLLSASFRATVDFGFGPLTSNSEDSVLLRLDPAGNLVWQKHITGPQSEEVRDLAIDGLGNIFVVGEFGQSIDLGCGVQNALGGVDAYLAKLDGSTGACLWSEVFGANFGEVARAVAVDGAGNVIIGGIFALGGITLPGGITFANAGSIDLFYASYDTNGVHRWSHAVGGSNADHLYDLAVKPSGEVVIVGSLTSDFATFDPLVTAPATVGEDFFVATLSGVTGGVTGLFMPTATGHDRAKSIAFDPLGDLILGFELDGTVDLGQGPLSTSNVAAVVARLQGDTFALDWATVLSGSGVRLEAVAVDAYGDPRVLGHFTGTMSLGPISFTAVHNDAIYVASLNGVNGAARWTTIGQSSTGDEEAMPALAVDALGHAYIGGRYGNHLATDFQLGDAAPVGNSGIYDAFFAKLTP